MLSLLVLSTPSRLTPLSTRRRFGLEFTTLEFTTVDALIREARLEVFFFADNAAPTGDDGGDCAEDDNVEANDDEGGNDD